MKKLIDILAYRHASWEVFSDFVEISAISLANAVNVFDCEDREKRYHDIIKKYKPEELEKFPQLFAMLVDRFEHETTDHLGALFHELELHNKYKGQYFTPYPLCKMLAKLTLGDPAKAIEALELGLIELEGEYVEHEMTTDYDLAIHKQEQALKSLKAFKDGAPEGLKDNVENIIIRDGYVETINEEGIKDIIVFYKAAKHLQKGIK